MPNTDAFPITPGTGRNVMVDHDLTAPDGTASVDAQGVKMLLGAAQAVSGFVDGRLISGSGVTGGYALFADVRWLAVPIKVTPTVSTTPASSAKDAVGGLMTFSGAARANGGTGRIVKVLIEDKGQQMKALDLVIFNTAPAASTDNAIFAPSDAELAPDLCEGTIRIGEADYADFSTNSLATWVGVLPFKCASGGTGLTGQLVSRSSTGPTYTGTTDIVVTIFVEQD